ncbi:glycosyl transferase family 2 [Capnocytophaga catalasegens]|uniref:Glycosyl transferase family 2 n=2 Tax=Capnocytophaga catalasegens TaxID=1004260 RepID=A0AAV5AWS0_9FLAO|nr:glycosyltransferase family 2 protein [Capnocytophaga catalasegens]GIZ16435.1 glycosyl transferase family 2 [Capnocytophaga catalasegens]GJM50326.1 glycosyl transferase family 2 [Capnocytophaga catalasegens]GJM53843.1 glycosyl transferase family 2 [Capnocytophaga catalasegens]
MNNPMKTKQIDIVVPCYNESGNISVLYEAIQKVFSEKSLENYTYNLIFVNDGSSDDSLEILQRLSNQYENVKYISFSRNFGHQLAVKAGLDAAMGDAVISMDADLQHPPALIPELVKKWEEGNQVVATIREYAPNAANKIKKSSKYFYKILNLISDIEIKDGAADFRLLDKSVISVIRSMDENEPFLRGMIPWAGFKQIYIPYIAQKRHSGETKYTLKKMLHLALAGVTAFSVKPLYFAVYLGFAFSILSILYVPYVIFSFINGTEISGWASLIMTIVFFGGLQLIILGIIGIYIGKIFKQTKNRPNYIIQERKL